MLKCSLKKKKTFSILWAARRVSIKLFSEMLPDMIGMHAALGEWPGKQL
jgi:hypothetical protein